MVGMLVCQTSILTSTDLFLEKSMFIANGIIVNIIIFIVECI